MRHLIFIMIVIVNNVVIANKKKDKIIMQNLKYLWSIDTCESLGFRNSFYTVLHYKDYNSSNYNTNLKSFKMKDIQFICGKPILIDTVGKNTVYNYFSYAPISTCECKSNNHFYATYYWFEFNKRGRLVHVQYGFMY